MRTHASKLNISENVKKILMTIENKVEHDCLEFDKAFISTVVCNSNINFDVDAKDLIKELDSVTSTWAYGEELKTSLS